jgi:hypothetical protein
MVQEVLVGCCEVLNRNGSLFRQASPEGCSKSSGAIHRTQYRTSDRSDCHKYHCMNAFTRDNQTVI